MRIIQFDKEDKYIEEFIYLPKKLYNKKDIVQNENLERELLMGKHCLNKYFKQYKFLMLKGENTIGRCILTIYPEDKIGYIGFFECIEDIQAGKAMLEYIHNIAKTLKLSSIQGPIDSSFWIKYRLKMDMFDGSPYTSEPYNKAYYKEIFFEAGYNICQEYISNKYAKGSIFDKQFDKYREKWKQVKEQYKIVTPNKSNFEIYLQDIYTLITNLYSNFPIYKNISKEDFIQMYKEYNKIADFNLVKIVYFEEQPVGFMLGLPDYSNLLYNLNTKNKMKIFFKKIRTKRYVSLYIGVERKHIQLSRYFIYETIRFLWFKNSTIVNALISSQKPNTNYAAQKIIGKNRYCLFEKKV